MPKLVALVKMNGHLAYVLDEKYSLTYEQYENLLVGSDDTNTFYNVLYYSPCGGNPNFGGNYAFGGRKFDLQMKNGTVTHCYGQYWDGRYSDAEKILGIEFADFPNGTMEHLRECYVFYGGTIDHKKLNQMMNDFFAEHPSYKLWEYDEYKKRISNKEEKNK